MAALALTLPGSASAQTAIGAPFQVSGTPHDYQWSPSIASGTAGELVVVWETMLDSSSFGISGQRYDTLGPIAGGDFTNPFFSASLATPVVATDPTGNFVVAWADGTTNPGIRAQRYARDGTPLGAELQVNTFTGSQYTPGVAVDGSGNFVVVWRSNGQDGSGDGVFGRRFDSTGTPRGGEFQVNTTTTGDQGDPAVASGPGGDFVVVWRGDGPGGYGSFGQRFDAAGGPQGSEFRIDSGCGTKVSADAAGNFVVASCSAQRFDHTGAPLGSSDPLGDEPAIASNAAGELAVVWRSGTTPFVYGQTFDPSGTPEGGGFQVGATPDGAVRLPSVAIDAAGDFVVAWAQYDMLDATRSDIWAQRYAGPCGNGRIGQLETCDDGNTTGGDGCGVGCLTEPCFTCTGEPSICTPIPHCSALCVSGGTVDTGVTMVVDRLLPPTGDEKVTFAGKLRSVPLASGEYDPTVAGAQFRLEDAGILLDVTGPSAIPPGLVGTGCGPHDGWKVRGLVYTYANRTNALPPGCIPGSAQGLAVVKLKDRLAVDGTFVFQVKAKNASIDHFPAPPLTATLVLGADDASASGRCALEVFSSRAVKNAKARYAP